MTAGYRSVEKDFCNSDFFFISQNSRGKKTCFSKVTKVIFSLKYLSQNWFFFVKMAADTFISFVCATYFKNSTSCAGSVMSLGNQSLPPCLLDIFKAVLWSFTALWRTGVTCSVKCIWMFHRQHRKCGEKSGFCYSTTEYKAERKVKKNMLESKHCMALFRRDNGRRHDWVIISPRVFWGSKRVRYNWV